MRLHPAAAALAVAAILAGTSHARIDATVPDATYETIQEAIDAAAADPEGGTITVLAGTYGDLVTLRRNVILRAEETGRTILTGGVAAEGGGSLQRFTVTSTRATFSGISNLELRNNVFRGISGVALDLQNVTGATVTNNTFYGNGTGLALAGSTGTVQANLFAANSTRALSWDFNTGVSFSTNFFDRASDDVTDATAADRDPLLVNPAAGDVHLRTGSPCINAAVDSQGNDTDQGAYGGTGADTRPFPVSGLTALVDAAGSSATLTWEANQAYDVTGYSVSYGPTTAYGGVGAGQGPSPVSVVGPAVTTLTLTGLAVETDRPATVQGLRAFPRNGGVLLEWDPAARATGYRVLWGLAGAALDNSAEAGAATTFTVTGLTNDTTYAFAVRSLGGTTHHFAVAASAGGRLSVLSADFPAPVTSLEGELTAEVNQTPEVAVGFPDLDDKGGCFLRAATGSAPVSPLLAALGALAALLAGARLGRRFWLGCAGALLLLGLAPQAGRAEGIGWSLSAKGGVFFPGESGWDDHYDRKILPDWRVGVGLRLASRLELGVEGGFRTADGEVTTTRTGQPLGRTLNQTLEVVPAQAYLVYDFRGGVDQLLVPYLGAGYSRYYYRHEVEEGETSRGQQQGFHLRGGLKLLLNRADPEAARKARAGWGLARTYACLEGQYARVDDFGSADADLGGWSVLAGASLEF